MWPLSNLTQYVAGTTPWIKASDLNAIQDGIVGLYNGTWSVKTLYVDSTGGNPVTQLPGLVVANRAVTQTTLPNTVAYSAGTVAQGTVARGWAVVNADGSFARGHNVRSAGRNFLGTAHGSYTVLFDTFPADPANACVACTLMSNVELPSVSATPSSDGGRLSVNVFITTGFGLPLPYDAKFSLLVFAE